MEKLYMFVRGRREDRWCQTRQVSFKSKSATNTISTSKY